MAKYFIFILLAIIYYKPVLGNQIDKTKEDSLARQVFSGTSNIWLKNGDLYRGYGFSIQQDSILLFTMAGQQKFKKHQIVKVKIKSDHKSYKYGFAGLFLGVILGNIIFYHEDFSPTAYLDARTDETFYWLLNFLFAGAGAGLGVLIDMSSDQGYEFDLLTDIDDWQKLKNLQSGKMNSVRNWHFAVQSAWVFPRIKSIFDEDLKELGHNFYDYYYPYKSKFNLLRKIQLTYSIDQNFEVGAAVIWQGERNFNTYYENSYITFLNDITGYYAVGIYNLLSHKQTKSINIKLGLALGYANINFETKYENYFEGYNFSYILNKSLYSQIIFTEFLVEPMHGISLGMAADYSWSPAQTIPEIPLTSIKSKKINFGNSSIGFLMRLNF